MKDCEDAGGSQQPTGETRQMSLAIHSDEGHIMKENKSNKKQNLPSGEGTFRQPVLSFEKDGKCPRGQNTIGKPALSLVECGFSV
ncbi:hypothetical protein P7K49_024044 [Saguinus oedipus]|uniref:Uncharacterized protein n=1 Tax=Saguinus oedipus TaxID=9490 RepID=A0ABQ9UNE9_SAGOE|nr:hypothetical protein P7K49_024044 [Saguinus oedipus]